MPFEAISAQAPTPWSLQLSPEEKIAITNTDTPPKASSWSVSALPRNTRIQENRRGRMIAQLHYRNAHILQIPSRIHEVSFLNWILCFGWAGCSARPAATVP